MNQDREYSEEAQEPTVLVAETPLKMLSSHQIRLIDDALNDLGPFGEVRLIKAKDKLRFIQSLESKSAL